MATRTDPVLRGPAQAGVQLEPAPDLPGVLEETRGDTIVIAGVLVLVGSGLVERVADSQDDAEAASGLVLKGAVELIRVLGAGLEGMSPPHVADRESRSRAATLAVGQRPEPTLDEAGSGVDEQRLAPAECGSRKK